MQSLELIKCNLKMTIQRNLYFPVRSQISTITMAAFNTTVASFNVGYADFFTEHMKKMCNPVAVPEMPVEPLACANLPRSFTDSCINYSFLEEGENIEGTNNFVLKNGMLDLTVSGSGPVYDSLRKAQICCLGFCELLSSLSFRLFCGLSMPSSVTTSAPESATWPSTSLTVSCSWAWCPAWARNCPGPTTRRTRRRAPKTRPVRHSVEESREEGQCQEQAEEETEAVVGVEEAGGVVEGVGRGAKMM